MIYIIDDDEVMAGCIARFIEDLTGVRMFRDGVSAMEAISEGEMPELIFLDILLNGADGFTFLNEMVSYADTAAIPVVIISSLDFSGRDLSEYGVVGALSKEKMRPEEIRKYVKNLKVEFEKHNLEKEKLKRENNRGEKKDKVEFSKHKVEILEHKVENVGYE